MYIFVCVCMYVCMYPCACSCLFATTTKKQTQVQVGCSESEEAAQAARAGSSHDFIQAWNQMMCSILESLEGISIRFGMK